MAVYDRKQALAATTRHGSAGRITRIGSSVSEQAVPPINAQGGSSNSFRRRSRAELVAARAAASAEMLAAKEAASPKVAVESAKPSEVVESEDLGEMLGARPLPWRPEPEEKVKLEEVRIEREEGGKEKDEVSMVPLFSHGAFYFFS